MPMFDELRNLPHVQELDDRSGAILWIAFFAIVAIGFAIGWWAHG